MRKTDSPLKRLLTLVIVPILVCICILRVYFYADNKYHNPYYRSHESITGGYIIKGIPIPVLHKEEQLPPYSQKQMEAIKSEVGSDVNINNIRNNRKWYKYSALGTFLEIVIFISVIICIGTIKEFWKEYS
jgi:hypothetical protein